MKKVYLVLAVLLVVVMVSGCGIKKEEVKQGVTKEKSTEVEGGSETIDDITECETSFKNPAELGQWVESSVYSVPDKLDHKVYLRVTDIVRGSEAQAIVDEYNSNEENLKEFDAISDDKVEFCVMSYEIYFPEDFPESSGTSDISFSIKGTDDLGGIEGTDGKYYTGLSNVYDITPEVDMTIKPNSTVQGKAVFYMLKGVSDYVIQNIYNSEKIDIDNIKTSYIRGK